MNPELARILEAEAAARAAVEHAQAEARQIEQAARERAAQRIEAARAASAERQATAREAVIAQAGEALARIHERAEAEGRALEARATRRMPAAVEAALAALLAEVE